MTAWAVTPSAVVGAASMAVAAVAGNSDLGVPVFDPTRPAEAEALVEVKLTFALAKE